MKTPKIQSLSAPNLGKSHTDLHSVSWLTPKPQAVIAREFQVARHATRGGATIES
mgnify:CR=1 FL=1